MSDPSFNQASAEASASRFRNSRVVYENSLSPLRLAPGSELTFNPYYAMSLSLRPRWYFTDQFSVRARMDIEHELTESDVTTQSHETRISDVFLDLVYTSIFTVPQLDIQLDAGLRIQIPTSLLSQAETQYLAAGPDLRLTRSFDVLDGLVLSYQFRYLKYVNRFSTVQREVCPYGQPASAGELAESGALAVSSHCQLGQAARSHGFFNLAMVRLDFLRGTSLPMNLMIAAQFMNFLTYGLPEAGVDVAGRERPVTPLHDAQNHQAAIWYVVALGMELTPWMSATLGASSISPQLRPDSTYTAPFFNRYTNIYMNLTFDIERFVVALRQ